MDAATLQLRITSEGMTEAQRGLDGLSNAASMVEDAVKKMAAAFAAYKVADWVKDTALLSARYDTLGVAMLAVGKNAGYTATAMSEYQQALQATGISATEARSTLTMMASAHIDMANSSKLARIAQDAAVIGNMNSSEAFQRMVHGIQSGQVEVLRTIGINVNFESSYKKLALQLGKTTQDLTEMEKVTARTNVVLDKGKDIAGTYEAAMGTVGKQLKSMERYAEDLRVQLGEVFQPSMSVLVESMATSVKGMSEWMVKNKQATTEMGLAMAEVVRQSDGFLGLMKKIAGGDGADSGGGMWVATKAVQLFSLAIADLRDAFSDLFGGATWFVGMLAKVGEMGLGKLIGGKPSLNSEGFLNYGQRLLEPLFSGNSANDSWRRGTFGTRESTADYLIAADMSAGLNPANDTYKFFERQREDKRMADMEMARRAMAESVNTKARMPQEESGFLYYSLEPRYVHEIEVAVQDYGKSLQGVEAELKKFKAENMTTWEIIGKTVAHSSQMATDAMVNWMDNLDGVGRSWRTLGDTVSAVLRDMIIQMQRAIIQQQLMDPLMKWGASAIVSAFGGSGSGIPGDGYASTGLNFPGYAQGTNYVPNDGLAYLHQGEAVIPAALNGKVGGSISSVVNVTINKSGEVSAANTSGSTSGSVDLAQRIKSAVQGVLIDERRAGGLLAAV